jgi:membrane protein
VLRGWLVFAFRRTVAYGALSAPVAVLLFLYLTALAILYGAELNAEIDRVWPRPETEGLREAESAAQ